MRNTSKGQVTIPRMSENAQGCCRTPRWTSSSRRTGVRLVKARTPHGQTRGAKTAELLRRGAGRITMTTDETTALTRGEA